MINHQSNDFFSFSFLSSLPDVAGIETNFTIPLLSIIWQRKKSNGRENKTKIPGPVSCELDGCISLQFIERRRTKNRLVLGHADERKELACLLQRKKQQKKKEKRRYIIFRIVFKNSFWLISSDADWFIIDNKIRLSFPGTAVPISYTNQINTCTSSSIYDTQ